MEELFLQAEELKAEKNLPLATNSQDVRKLFDEKY